MVNFEEVMTTYFNECISRGYEISDKDVNEIIISKGNEEVELDLDFSGENKLNINFYRNEDATDEFVNILMRLFSTIVNKETVSI